jgi:hypothetical protein
MKLRLALLSCLLAVAAFAADVTGKWSAEVHGRGGRDQTVTFNLQQNGDSLTGTVAGPRGEAEIKDGKVNGDSVSFSVVREFNGNSIKINYEGKVSGNEIQFQSRPEGHEDRTQQFTAKRTTST